MSLPAEGYQLKGISAKAYEHPADRAATAALKSIPHLDRVVGKIIEYGYERAIRRGVLGAAAGSAVRRGADGPLSAAFAAAAGRCGAARGCAASRWASRRGGGPRTS